MYDDDQRRNNSGHTNSHYSDNGAHGAQRGDSQLSERSGGFSHEFTGGFATVNDSSHSSDQSGHSSGSGHSSHHRHRHSHHRSKKLKTIYKIACITIIALGIGFIGVQMILEDNDPGYQVTGSSSAKSSSGKTETTDYTFSGTRSRQNNRVWCDGMTICWIGDGIVAGEGFDEIVCRTLGLTEKRYGRKGSTIALNAEDPDDQNALCVRFSQMEDDADIIAVSCGTNDFQYACCPVGTIDSTDNNTFYGALKNLCEGLINKYPQKILFFTTPVKRAQPFRNLAGGDYTPDDVSTTPFSKNKYGMTLGDYAAIIREVCSLYSIPVLDLYNESLLNPHIESQAEYFIDETHPNAEGRKIIARRVCGWLAQLGYELK